MYSLVRASTGTLISGDVRDVPNAFKVIYNMCNRVFPTGTFQINYGCTGKTHTFTVNTISGAEIVYTLKENY